jgi:Bacterial extracellular solute-binding protein
LTIAPVTSICTVPGVALVGPLPEQYQLKTAYFAAITSDAADSEAAHQLMTMLFSDDFAEIMKQKCIDVQ